jgi:hypothetical protein
MRAALLAAACVFGLTISSANAATVVAGFEGASLGSFRTGSLTENGITFTIISGHYDIMQGDWTGHLMNIDNVNYGPTTLKITYSGGLFDLTSFTTEYDNGTFTITSDKGDSYVVPQSTTTVANNFSSSFTGVSTLIITQTGSGYFSFDNFTITTAQSPGQAPLPGALPMLGSGLAGLLGFARWRRRASAA